MYLIFIGLLLFFFQIENDSIDSLTGDEKVALVEKDPNVLNSLLSLPMNNDSVPLSEINLQVKDVESTSDDSFTIPIYYKTLPAGGLKNIRSDNAHNLSSENTMKDGCGNIVHLRRKPRVQKSKLKRRCSINGHFYNREVNYLQLNIFNSLFYSQNV